MLQGHRIESIFVFCGLITKMNYTFEDLSFLKDSDAAEVEDENGSCKLFYGSFGPMFHAGNLFLGLAFAIPQWMKFQKVCLRGLMTFGMILLTAWSAIKICAGTWFIYNLVTLTINAIYFITLAIKHFPVIVPKNMEGVYTKMFKPLNMGKKVSANTILKSISNF